MNHGMKTIWTATLAGLLALGSLACSGSNGERGPIPPQAIRRDVVVTVSTTSATAFNGFELTLTFDDSFMVAKMPLATFAGESGLAAGMVCTTVLGADDYMLTCGNPTALMGATEIAAFTLEYDDFVPDAGDFSVACSFVDENGAAVGVGCDFDFAI